MRRARRTDPMRHRLLHAWAPLAALLASLVVSAAAGTLGARRIDAAADAQLEAAAAGAAFNFESMLGARLRALESIAAFDSPLGGGGQESAFRRAMLQSIGLRYPEFAWIGFTDAAGRVDAARDGMLVGADVSARDWWQAGLRGPYLGEVHEAKLLASLLPPGRDGEPHRFLDIAVPIRAADGTIRGVLGGHVDARWMIGVRDEIARTMASVGGMTLRLMLRDGTTVARETLHLDPAGEGGRRSATLEGRPMAAVARPLGGDVVVERLGWQVVALRDADAHAAAGRSFLSAAIVR